MKSTDHVRGAVPTRPEPAALDPLFLDAIVRPVVPPSVRAALIQATTAALLDELETAPE